MQKLLLVGAGGIGKQWASGIRKSETVRLTGVVDTDAARARELAAGHDECAVFTDWRAALAADFDGAIVATPHCLLAPIARGFLEAGHHVLVEKPTGVNSAEVAANIALARERGLVYMAGFNHRYHPAFAEAKQRFVSGTIGEPMFIRARHGFGGRAGYEHEWRFNRSVSGGGEFIDQGMHMIDMARWFFGDFVDVEGFAENMFWGGDVEDNGFALLRTKERAIASIHVSWTNWDWIHAFEIFGTRGYLVITGLDQRYHGPERLTIGTVDPRSGGFPVEEVIVYDKEAKDDSLRREAEAFGRVIAGHEEAIPRGDDALAALRLVEAIYAKNPPHNKK